MRAADAAWPAWAALPPSERARALEAYADLVDAEQPALAELVHRETGKPLGEAQAEVARAAEVIHHFAAEAERMWAQQMPGPTLATGSWVRPAPLGVVAAITPWNFPVALVVWKLAPGAGRRLRGGGQARRSRRPWRPGRSATWPSAPVCRPAW